MKRIGVMGGTFDPIHYGHLRSALELAEHLQLDQIRFIPSNIPPHRAQPGVSADKRRDMVALAIQSEPLFVLDDRELQRNGSSYSVDTMQSLRDELGESVQLFFLMGMDAAQGFTQWHRWQDILDLCHLVVFHRPSYIVNLQALLAYQEHDKQAFLSSAVGKVYCQSVTALDISATMIRQHLNQGLSVRYLMPQSSLDYLQEKQLYQ